MREAAEAEARTREEERAENARRRSEELARERAERIWAYDWPDRMKAAVLIGDVEIGMTKMMVLEAWGPPIRRNETETAEILREQWIYGRGRYVYFEDGLVTAIQRSR